MFNLPYYARTNRTSDKTSWQLLKDHLASVSEMAGRFSAEFNQQSLGEAIGLLHDIGKYSPEFVRRLNGSNERVVHSTAGACLARDLSSPATAAFARLAEFCIAGHHAGLPDYGPSNAPSSLLYRMNEPIPDFNAYKSEINPPIIKGNIVDSPSGFSVAMLTRMLFSALVDADSLDAEHASGSPESALRRMRLPDLVNLSRLLDAELERKKSLSDSKMNRIRQQIQEVLARKAAWKPGLYSLTVPTGGGKTLASLSFALKHALANGQKRIIYTIPYTSIIEQNADVYRRILGKEAVLEHHSNFAPPAGSAADETDIRLQLAAENWDSPLVVTTDVQFYESLFAASRSRCRKLHNITNSVIVLDEAQRIPTDYLRPCIEALTTLVQDYRCTVVLCTATQPALDRYLKERPVELMDDPDTLYERCRRVTCRYVGHLEDRELARRLSDENQALCIVNTRNHARRLYGLLGRDSGVWHLSANMCPAHRRAKLDEIRTALDNGWPCIVVSTSLVEAGVDLDFPTVFRASAGLDSIAQAAGRCNREGRPKLGQVVVFRPAEPTVGWLQRTAAIGEQVLQMEEFADDPLCLAAIKEYFRRLYAVEGDDNLDRHGILKRLKKEGKDFSFSFDTIAREFRLIEENTEPIVIPYDDGCRRLIEAARQGQPLREIARRLQAYTVQVRENRLEALVGHTERIAGMFTVLTDESLYSPDTGLLLD